MISYKPQLINILKQLALVFAIYAACRLLFFAFNKFYFQELTFGELCSLMFYGLRFDAFSIASNRKP